MQQTEAEILGCMLGQFLSQDCTRHQARELAREIGYNDSPILGRKRRRHRLLRELVTAHVAVLIVAVNQSAAAAHAKTVIDSLLRSLSAGLFGQLEAENSEFQSVYTQRVTEYFGYFEGPRPQLPLTFALLSHLGVEVRLTNQMALVARLGGFHSAAIDLIERYTTDADAGRLPPVPPASASATNFDGDAGDKECSSLDAAVEQLARFTALAESWPAPLRVQSMKVVTLFLDGKVAEGKTQLLTLPRPQFMEVQRLLLAIAATKRRSDTGQTK